MRVRWLVLSFLLILSSSSHLDSQQTATTAPRDPQAVDILKQCLNLAGGVSTIDAVADYTASGAITYQLAGKNVAGNVTLHGRGFDQFRMDTSLSTGARSWLANHGKAKEKAESGDVSDMVGLSLLSPSSLVFPYIQLTEALRNKSFSIEYKGLTQLNGASAHDIRIRRGVALPDGSIQMLEIGAVDILIDQSSLRVVLTRDQARPSRNSAQGPSHELRFSDFRSINNILTPFSISEVIGGQPMWQIQLSKIDFNLGLADSDFAY
jgi:hypothetical protein